MGGQHLRPNQHRRHPRAAGASQHAAVEDTQPDVAAALLRLNLEGPLALARAALPRMAAQGRGQHVVVASMSGEALLPQNGLPLMPEALCGHFGNRMELLG